VANVGILLFRCGPWMVGVDPLAVRTIRPQQGNEKVVDIGTFFRGESSEPQPGDKPRVLEVAGVKLRVDHAVGTTLLTLADVMPLSPVLERYGAPSWWIGTTMINEQLVLLVDLAQLAGAAA
jgi:hypothetical protein